MKKAQLFDIAEKMFVEDQMPLSYIAEKLDITEKTARNWRDEGDWKNKRKKFIKIRKNCNESLYELLTKVVGKMNEDFENGEAPSAGYLYFVNQMSNRLGKLKEYEDTKASESKECPETEDIARKVGELLGL